jgi:hypothetical protein
VLDKFYISSASVYIIAVRQALPKTGSIELGVGGIVSPRSFVFISVGSRETTKNWFKLTVET